jgi:hypothetical protein
MYPNSSRPHEGPAFPLVKMVRFIREARERRLRRALEERRRWIEEARNAPTEEDRQARQDGLSLSF